MIRPVNQKINNSSDIKRSRLLLITPSRKYKRKRFRFLIYLPIYFVKQFAKVLIKFKLEKILEGFEKYFAKVLVGYSIVEWSKCYLNIAIQQ